VCVIGEVTTVTVIGGGEQEVCANPGSDDATCEAGTCVNPCATNDDCLGDLICRDDGVCVACLTDENCEAGDLNTCINESTCGCSTNEECAGNPAGETCIVASGTCGCSADADCLGNDAGENCIEALGVCG